MAAGLNIFLAFIGNIFRGLQNADSTSFTSVDSVVSTGSGQGLVWGTSFTAFDPPTLQQSLPPNQQLGSGGNSQASGNSMAQPSHLNSPWSIGPQAEVRQSALAPTTPATSSVHEKLQQYGSTDDE